MSEEFIIEEEETQGGRSRTFLMILGGLLTLLVIGVICLSVIFINRNGDEDGGATEAELAATATSAAIMTINSEVAAANLQVTQTLAARATFDALPTDTPTPTETPIPPTATPTDTPAPTETPVVSTGDEGDETGGDEGDTGDEGDETGGGEADPTATVSVLSTPIAGNNAPTATPIVATGGDSGSGTLPQTGVSPWGAILAALGLLIVLLGARRLRTM